MESIHLATVTREEAEQWIGHTTFNRSISKRAIGFMKRDMEAGNWNSAVAPPIFIDEVGGGVIDGQHRLRAFLESNLETFTAYVAMVPRKSIEVIDTGRTRSLVDTLSIRGHEYGRQKSAWLNRGMSWAFGVKTSHVLTRKDQVEVIEAAPYADKAAEVAASMNYASKRLVVRMPTGIIACLWDMQQYGHGGDLVVEFVHRLQTSQGLDDLMSRLQAKMLDAVNPRTKLTMSGDTISYLVARVFSAWANDESLANILARRRAVYELAGYPEWVEATFPTLI